MDDLILILVHAMNTVDGKKNSAQKIKNTITDIKQKTKFPNPITNYELF